MRVAADNPDTPAANAITIADAQILQCGNLVLMFIGLTVPLRCPDLSVRRPLVEDKKCSAGAPSTRPAHESPRRERNRREHDATDELGPPGHDRALARSSFSRTTIAGC